MRDFVDTEVLEGTSFNGAHEPARGTTKRTPKAQEDIAPDWTERCGRTPAVLDIGPRRVA